MSVIDTYLKDIPEPQKKELVRIRAIALQIVPEAVEAISYGIPTLKYKGKGFLGFDVAKNHIGIYPFGGEEIEVFKEELDKHGYGYSKGTIRVPFDKPIPEELLKKIILHRIRRIPTS